METFSCFFCTGGGEETQHLFPLITVSMCDQQLLDEQLLVCLHRHSHLSPQLPLADLQENLYLFKMLNEKHMILYHIILYYG